MKATGFASDTTVSASQTRADIERLVDKRMVKFRIQLPSRNDKAFNYKRGYMKLSDSVATARYEQACRTIWRRLVIKAKLESVASQIETFEMAFAAYIVITPDGQTVGDQILPQIAEI